MGRGSQPLEPRSRGNLGNNWMSTSPGWQWPSHCFLPKVLQVSYGVCEAGKAVEWTAQSNIKSSHVSSGPGVQLGSPWVELDLWAGLQALLPTS